MIKEIFITLYIYKIIIVHVDMITINDTIIFFPIILLSLMLLE